MDAVPALIDQPVDLFDTHSSGVIVLLGTPRNESARTYRKDDRMEKYIVLLVERAVDENILCISSRHISSLLRPLFPDDANLLSGGRLDLSAIPGWIGLP